MAERALTTGTETPGYCEFRVGQAWVLALVDHEDFVKDALSRAGSLYAWAQRQPEARSIQGRRPLQVVPWPPDEASGGEAVVRMLHHGGLLAGMTGRRFLRGRGARPFNEIHIASALDRAGIPTPMVLAACVYPRGVFYSGEVARRWLADTCDLAAALFDSSSDPADQNSIMTAAGDLVGRLHHVGLYHPDLNLRNILVRDQGNVQLFIIDLEKARIVPGLSGGKRRRMLERLRRSARRFATMSGRRLGAEAWPSFEEGYARHRH